MPVPVGGGVDGGTLFIGKVDGVEPTGDVPVRLLIDLGALELAAGTKPRLWKAPRKLPVTTHGAEPLVDVVAPEAVWLLVQPPTRRTSAVESERRGSFRRFIRIQTS
jgi:hypothetical protein